MKTYLIAGLSILLFSCGTDSNNGNEATEEIESITYTLNKKQSILNWHGEENKDHFHKGTISFSEGILVMKGDEVVSGNFVVDMNTMSVVDDMPDDKKEKLIGHLGNEDFFNISTFPKTTVTIISYKENEMTIGLDVMGSTIESIVPVSIEKMDNSVNLMGQFNIDFSSLKLPGLTPDPETGEGILPVISFDLAIELAQ